MTVARSALRQEIAKRMGRPIVGTVTSSSTASVLFDQDDEFVTFQEEGGPELQGWWIVLPAASATNRVRRVSFHDKGSGQLKPSRAWSAAPANGDTYELWPPDMHPNRVDEAINRGLPQLRHLTEETLTLVSGDNDYTLSYSWLENERDVYEVYHEITSSLRIYRSEYEWFKVHRDNAVFKLRLWPIPYTTSNYAVIIEGRARYATLATDAATTDCPTDWAAAVGHVELLRHLIRQNHGQDVSRFEKELMEARRVLRKMTVRYAPRRGRRIMPRTPTSMPGNPSTPRRGEFLY